MLQPRSIGGAELRPVSFAQVTEAIAAADASTGWVRVPEQRLLDVGGVSGAGGGARDLRAVDGILAWGPPGAPFEAQPVEGGYRISGKWRFASGSHHATWLGAHMRVAGTGAGKVRTMLFPKSSVTMHDIWHVVGLARHRQRRIRGGGPVRAASTTRWRATARRERREDGLLYRFTSNQLYSCGFAGVGLGIARGHDRCVP